MAVQDKHPGPIKPGPISFTGNEPFTLSHMAAVFYSPTLPSTLHSTAYSSFHPNTSMGSELIIHSGGCHCKKVKWQVSAPASVVAWQCNCSDCYMRGNIHFIVPSERFELMGNSMDFLTTYTFGTHTAKHTFCKVCGITSFYFPRSNPDGVAITYRCVDPGTIEHVEIQQFDGRNWDRSYAQTGIDSCSKLSSE